MEYVLIIFVYYSGLSTSNLAVTNVPVQSIEMCKIAAAEVKQQTGERTKTICVKVKE
jgi:hypothetical protein